MGAEDYPTSFPTDQILENPIPESSNTVNQDQTILPISTSSISEMDAKKINLLNGPILPPNYVHDLSPSLRDKKRIPPILYVPSTPKRQKHTDINEQTEYYLISSTPIDLDFPLDHSDLDLVDVDDEARMLNPGYIPSDVVLKLWKQKNRMDKLFDDNNSNFYYETRDNVFPQDKRGSLKFANRAGDKLWQTHLKVAIFSDIPHDWSFFDICGGPGAFSKLLLSKDVGFKYGFGMSLRVPMTDKHECWYPSIEHHPRFHIIWGEDNDGDVYVPGNLKSAANTVKHDKIGVVVSDGGFKIQKIEDKHKENLQELFSGRIILSEFTLMTQILEEGGHFVVKLFDTTSHLTVSLIYLATLLFKDVYVVKPQRSRIVNSERYLVGRKYKRHSKISQFCRHLLDTLHSRLYDHQVQHPEQLVSPNSAIPLDTMKNDTIFMTSIVAMISELAEKQTKALQIIMDEVDLLLEKKNQDKVHSILISGKKCNSSTDRHYEGRKDHRDS